MVTPEPRLSPDDHRCWDILMRTATAHSRTNAHKRSLDKAKAVIAKALAVATRPSIASSFAKDSMPLTHLICVELGHRVPVYCHRDDLDFPGSIEHTERCARDWGLDLTILAAPFSLAEWLDQHTDEIWSYADFHGRASELAKKAFYAVVDAHASQFDLIFLGLRKDESYGRKMNRLSRGLLYKRKTGPWIATPLGDWHGLDPYAYCAARGLELPALYKCIAFMHSREPWRVREAWWLPEHNTARYGGVAWLRHYYPSLYSKLTSWFPETRSMA